jgi:hypothetical protein
MSTHYAPTLWFLNGPLLLLYVIEGLLVYVLCVINDRVVHSPRRQKPLSPAVIAALALVSQLLGVVTFVALANALSGATHLGMLGLPLLILFNRYLRVIRKAPRRWQAPAGALAGSVAGLGSGAWLFMRNATGAEPIGHVVLPGTVHTLRISEVMASRDWTISLQLVLFYVIALAIFFCLHAVLKRSSLKLMAVPESQRKKRTAWTILIAFATNFLGVVLLVWLADRADIQARLAMVGLPLLLILEAYVKLLRSQPRNRPSHWSGLIGSSAGMVIATFFLLRGAPLH